jgi:hypothetical protein
MIGSLAWQRTQRATGKDRAPESVNSHREKVRRRVEQNRGQGTVGEEAVHRDGELGLSGQRSAGWLDAVNPRTRDAAMGEELSASIKGEHRGRA